MIKSAIISKLNLDEMSCTSANKNISVGDEYKYILTALEYAAGEVMHRITVSYQLNLGGQVSRNNPVKIAVWTYVGHEVKSRDKVLSFSEVELTEDLLNAVQDVELLFDAVNTENKRVYL